MTQIAQIIKIADDYHDQEMDSWYFGPCDEVYEMAKKFDLKLWDSFLESTKVNKPDMWRVFLSHAFFEDDGYIGKSQEFIALQASMCADSDDAYLIIQYMDNFNWVSVPMWLRDQMILKLEKMQRDCSVSCLPLLDEVLGAISKANS